MKRSLSPRVKPKDFARLVASWFSEIDCARSLTLLILFRNKEYEQIANLDCNPSDYPDRVSFHRAYLATKFLSKFGGFGNRVETFNKAIQAFLTFEEQCYDTNRRLKESSIFLAEDVGDVFHIARVKIERLLRDVNSDVLELIFENSAFGPGVTTSHRGKWLGPHEKLHGNHEVTAPLNFVLQRAKRPCDYPSWEGLTNPILTFGNKVVTVPKNSKTDRTIAVEPGINAYFQRGVGVYLRRKLKSWGLTLRDQSRNRELARIASLTGAYATLDLKGASDTISSEVVQELLPASWVKLLETLRSHRYILNGEIRTYHKHSSMGNGYTFELESLIFASLVKACLKIHNLPEDDFRVYGDDLIVPTIIVPLLVRSLSHLGFLLNESKSFSSGPFRESCGGDFYEGHNVTPFYFRTDLSINQLITFANWLRDTDLPFDASGTWRVAVSSIPKNWRAFGPVNAPFMCIHVKECELDPFSVHLKRRPFGPILGYKLRGLHFRGAERDVEDSSSSLAATLYLHERGNLSRISPFAEYRRKSAARKMGRWYTTNYVFEHNWEDPKFLKNLWLSR